MDKRKFFARTLIMLFTISVFLFLLVSNSLTTTTTRFVKQDKDEIYARYTALYFRTSIKEAAIAYENGKAYISFEVFNYEGTWVTQRDIEYIVRIDEVDYYYNDGSNYVPIKDKANHTGPVYVKDVWGNNVEVGKDTLKYDSDLVEFQGESVTHNILDGEGNKTGEYTNQYFTYEPLGATGVSKTHKLTVELNRLNPIETLGKDENVSLVIELVKPYRQIYVINLTISDKIITFASNDSEKFETALKTIKCQTVNVFSHTYNGENRVTASSEDSLNGKNYLSEGVLVEFVFNGLYLDEHHLGTIHMPSNGSSYSNIDITQPFIIPQNGDAVTYNGNTGTLRMYVPQASEFELYFLPIAEQYSVKVNIKVSLEEKGYTLYDDLIAGYTHTDNYYTIMSHPDSND